MLSLVEGMERQPHVTLVRQTHESGATSYRVHHSLVEILFSTTSFGYTTLNACSLLSLHVAIPTSENSGSQKVCLTLGQNLSPHNFHPHLLLTH